MMEPLKRVLITGGSGFVGTHIINKLESENYKVYSLEHVNTFRGNAIKRNIIPIKGDLSSDLDYKKFPNELDGIIHCAAILPSNKSSDVDNSTFFEKNVIMASNICRLAKFLNAKHVIYSSTANMYKNSLDLASENSTIEPSIEKEYFQSKLSAEKYMESSLGEANILYSTLRISTPFGPGEASTKVIPTLLMNAFRGKDLTLLGSEDSSQNYCYVSDIAAAFTRCFEGGHNGKFNIGSKKSTKLIELAEEIRSIFPNSKSEIKLTKNSEYNLRSFAPIDISKSESEMDFKPGNLRMGLIKYAEHLGILTK